MSCEIKRKQNITSCQMSDLFTNSSLQPYTNQTSANLSLRPRNEDLARIEITLQAIILVLNVLGNGAVLSMLACMSRGKNLSRMYTMIGHLSCADLFVAVFNILPQLLWDVTFRFRGGRVICKSVKYLQVTAIYAPSYVLLSTAIDRYIAICHPMRGHTWSSTTAHRLVIYSWILALLFSIPQLFIFDYVNIGGGVYDCWENFSPPWTLQMYITWFTLAVYVVPLVVLTIIYTKICLVVWHSSSDKATPMQAALAKINQQNYQVSLAVSNNGCHPSKRLSGRDDLVNHKSEDVAVKEKNNPANLISDETRNQCCRSDTETGANHNRCCENHQDASVNHRRSCMSHRDCGMNHRKSCMSHSDCGMSHQQGDMSQPESSTSHNNCSASEKEFRISHYESCTSRRQFSNSEQSAANSCECCTSREKRSRSNCVANHHNASMTNQDSGSNILTDPSRTEASIGSSRTEASINPVRISRRDDLRIGTNFSNGFAGTTFSPNPTSRARMRTVKLTLTVVVSYLLCWGPFFFAQMWYAWDPNANESLEETWVVLTLLLASLNSCTNPWIYLAFSDHLRRRLVYFCYCLFRGSCCRLPDGNSAELDSDMGFLRRSRIKLSYTSSSSRFDSRHRANR